MGVQELKLMLDAIDIGIIKSFDITFTKADTNKDIEHTISYVFEKEDEE